MTNHFGQPIDLVKYLLGKQNPINERYKLFEKIVSKISEQEDAWIEAIEVFLNSTDGEARIDGRLYANIYKKLLQLEINFKETFKGDWQNPKPTKINDKILLPIGISHNL
jgi:hypothetical protein